MRTTHGVRATTKREFVVSTQREERKKERQDKEES